jgi:hypothetical protein
VKSPLLHYIAEAPETREEFLDNIWLYYLYRKKQPDFFSVAVNATNTKGETLLDYLESLKQRGINSQEGQQEPLKNIIEFACAHGGIYALNKIKKCPLLLAPEN